MTDNQQPDEFEEHRQQAEQEEPPQEAEEQVEEQAEEQAEEPKQMVPLATLLEERGGFQATIGDLRSTVNDLKEQIAELSKKPEQVPDPEEDPFGHLNHQIKQTQETVQSLGKAVEEQGQTSQQQQAMQQMQSMEDTFVKDHPDYYEAMEHLKQSRLSLMTGAGMALPDAQQAFNNEAAWLVQTSLKNGKNFAEVAYDFAKAAGWQAKEKVEENTSLKALAKAQGQSQSLSNASGKRQEETPDASGLTHKEFDSQFVGHDNEDAWEKMMTG